MKIARRSSWPPCALQPWLHIEVYYGVHGTHEYRDR